MPSLKALNAARIWAERDDLNEGEALRARLDRPAFAEGYDQALADADVFITPREMRDLDGPIHSDKRHVDLIVAVDKEGLAELVEALKTTPPDGMSPTSEARIMAAIRDLEQTMALQSSKLSASIAALLAKETGLEEEIAAVLADDVANRKTVTDAVAKALADAGVAEDDAAATLDTVNAALDKQSANITAFLSPTPPPAAVVITPTEITGVAGGAVSGQFTAEGATGNLTWSATDLPPDITLTPDGLFTGAPEAAEAGDAHVTYTSDDGTTGEQDVTYTITAAAPD